ncbi:uncharacterized protein LOC123534635 [Mercenaria mercenaria]|uniref:uncharacterized protein LOC123534635 n=1 Tax=Mercenaria mercenaria TaxID=6596 RepID=UPI00234EFB27|nr:uncharacterized protein LOC123534635 [Mercenaria mercenaria]
MNHRNCKIDYIPDVSRKYISSPQYQSLLQALQTLHGNVQETAKLMKRNKKLIQENQDRVKADIQNFRQEISTKLDEWEAEIYKEIESLISGEHQRIDSALTQCNEITRKTELQQTNFKTLERDKKCNTMFIHGREIEESIKRDMKIEQELKRETKANSYIFQPNSAIKNLLETETSLGTLFNTGVESKANTIQDQAEDNKVTISIQIQSRPKHRENVSSSDISVTLLDQINVKKASDRSDCELTGLAVIDTDRLAVADYRNKSIKIVDVKQTTIVSELEMTSNPWDVTLLPGDQLAVTLPYEGLIHSLSFSDGLSKVRQQKTHGESYGLAFIEGNLIVGMADGKVKIMNLSGKVLKTMDCGVTDFVNNVTGCSNHICIYVSCGSSVTRFSMSGETVGRYTHESLKTPRGLAVLEDCSIFVCDPSNSSIHLISENLKSSRMILQETDELMKPYCMAIDSEEKELYIGSSTKCNYINFYRLK